MPLRQCGLRDMPTEAVWAGKLFPCRGICPLRQFGLRAVPIEAVWAGHMGCGREPPIAVSPRRGSRAKNHVFMAVTSKNEYEFTARTKRFFN
ncbi:hypothetical protein Pmar_PMAR000600 [Perkinsus marinus ATCC 50983]|uniref:Uncharacterized protein n=1 Tax=Perkinsus marinus (strain ATCC 50983 / TXsc) TaxID=423536 RepID=C5KA28_PERM5|nr:hypothetical protein Pmar_PMAR000600 [Perkinsus marinus ATCC 50983]EER18665.1 hypothetical protein Pmar_PMAR000600 [Perkinsus marinus ATCC 50983]|eukprot:XP_002786869.1 hypothetical protein Pmar_PMAR000600 [Perkinsus marinus ATCC 50983]